jgi:hypothetical protein
MNVRNNSQELDFLASVQENQRRTGGQRLIKTLYGGRDLLAEAKKSLFVHTRKSFGGQTTITLHSITIFTAALARTCNAGLHFALLLFLFFLGSLAGQPCWAALKIYYKHNNRP